MSSSHFTSLYFNTFFFLFLSYLIISYSYLIKYYSKGFEGSVIVGELLKQPTHDVGFNAQTGEYVNMIETGIMDPTKVVRTALLDAFSVSGLLMTTEAMVAEIPDVSAGRGGPPGGMGGGMGGMGGMGM